MKVLVDRKPKMPPDVSLVLLDWSVRESFHILHYLKSQTVPRGKYQVILIEYYGRRAEQIDGLLKEAREKGEPPPVDTWAVMEMPESIYYHKHLMYNVGIVLSMGRIVSLMDSDAVVRPTFIESIVKSFDEAPNIVLHLDQLRNFNRKFYPFNYPTIEQIENDGPTNALGGKPEGLLDELDPLRTRNYGACMCALRDDLIAIGGADEHMDYLGHVCGPYDLTFRLANAGKREVWHPSEWLYHTWHPGQAGGGNYVGPHDGRNVSTTALDVRRTGRTLPFRENPAMRRLRTEPEASASQDLLLELAISEVDINEWDHEKLDKSFVPEGERLERFYYLKKMLRHPVKYLRLAFPFLRMFLGQLGGRGGVLKALALAGGLWRQTWQYRGYVMERTRRCLASLSAEGVREIAVYGTGNVAEIFRVIAGEFPIRISARYGDSQEEGVLPLGDLKGYSGKLVVAENVKVGSPTVRKLKEAGVRAEDMVLLI